MLVTSESVLPGHPDKVCDQIADAVLDAALAVDPFARSAVEVFAHAGGFVLGGELSVPVDAVGVARRVLEGIGWSAELGLDPGSVLIEDRIVPQSAEISAAVSNEAPELLGAGDQGLMIGYATDETEALLPVSAVAAHALGRRLEVVARERGWGPDGKTQATVLVEDGVPIGLAAVVVSVQHPAGVDVGFLRELVLAEVVNVVSRELGLPLLAGAQVWINPSGSFVLGGPAADTGLSGRKLAVDTYGGAARHGGGAFSGKDATKVDRSGAYAARQLAVDLVSSGVASKAEVQVAYAIGVPEPVALMVDTFGTGLEPDDALAADLSSRYDLRPGMIIDRLGLRVPQFQALATFGHFGRRSCAWENALQLVE